jgi:simple sugar transport system substrate-binding protein
MESDLKKYSGQIQGVYAHNDELAIAAIQAIDAAGLKAGTDVKVIGFDATADGFKYLISGEMFADIECNPLLAPQVYKAALDALNGVTGQAAWVPSQEGQFFASQGADALKAILATRKY